MSGWNWFILLSLWAWAMVDIYLLRQAVDAGLRSIDQRRIDAMRALEAQLAEL